MSLTTLKDLLSKQHILLISRISGLLVVAFVNLLVFYPDSPHFSKINLFLHHANEAHHVNQSPFALNLSFHALPSHEMQSLPIIPVSIPQVLPALIATFIFSIMLFISCICFFRGEENFNVRFYPAVITPPPNRF